MRPYTCSCISILNLLAGLVAKLLAQTPLAFNSVGARLYIACDSGYRKFYGSTWFVIAFTHIRRIVLFSTCETVIIFA